MFKKSMLTVLILALGVLGGSVCAGSAWYEDYYRVQHLIDKGNFDDAAELLDPLITKYPEPEADLRIPGDRFIDYLPFYQRARIELARQNYDAASRSLEISQAFGASQHNRVVATDVLRMRELLNTSAMQPDAVALSTPATKRQ